MHAARPVFLDLADRPDLGEIAQDWQHRVDIHTAETDDRPADALLIRPDAHIAWAATIDEPTDTAAPALREALSGWFGDPLEPWPSSGQPARRNGVRSTSVRISSAGNAPSSVTTSVTRAGAGEVVADAVRLGDAGLLGRDRSELDDLRGDDERDA